LSLGHRHSFSPVIIPCSIPDKADAQARARASVMRAMCSIGLCDFIGRLLRFLEEV
jgi:hypothetical protein